MVIFTHKNLPMRKNYIIADSGATKCEWTLFLGNQKKTIKTIGISPYFLTTSQIVDAITKGFHKKVDIGIIDAVYFYGTGLSNPLNVVSIKNALKKVFPKAKLDIQTDLVAVARATCQNKKGVACILGTGSNTGFYNGKKIVKNSPGLGYVLGDEGSGAYLGKKVLQYYLYKTFDEELMHSFESKYQINKDQILDAIYKQPLPNRYMGSFAKFLSDHRGHYMIENIIEDGINDFFFAHLNKLNESWLHPIHFAGTIAYVFRDVIKQLAAANELEIGSIVKSPMEGLIAFHKKEK
jgi:N-acetylglucosamine kinase-like BadF-type ATPase